MAWRIDALRRFPDEAVERCLERHYGGGRRAGARDVTDDEHRWMQQVVVVAREIWPSFTVLEEDTPYVETPGEEGARRPWRVSLFDADAAVSVDVLPDRAHVTPLVGYTGDEVAGFRLFWLVCQALAREASCLIVDPNDMKVIEMELDVAAARDEYGWI